MDFSVWNPHPHTIERGQAYFRQGKVQKLERFGDVFSAQVSGQKIYQVVIDLRRENPSFSCTCLYESAGPCKHVFAVGNAIRENQFIAEYPHLSSDQAAMLDLVNMNAVRDRVKTSLTNDTYKQEEFLAEIHHWLAEDNIRNALRFLLGIYEGMGGMRTESPMFSQWFDQGMTSVIQSISPEKLSVKNAREIMDIIFLRWDKYEQLHDYIHPHKSFRYDFELLQPLMLALTFDKVIAHFLDMKFTGYGINVEKLVLLKKQMKSFDLK